MRVALLFAAVVLLLPAVPPWAQTRIVSGQAGIPGAWELTVTATRQAASGWSRANGADAAMIGGHADDDQHGKSGSGRGRIQSVVMLSEV